MHTMAGFRTPCDTAPVSLHWLEFKAIATTAALCVFEMENMTN